MFYICSKFHENVLKGFRVSEGHDFHLEIYKGRNSVNNVGGVPMLIFRNSSDHVLYLYNVL